MSESLARGESDLAHPTTGDSTGDSDRRPAPVTSAIWLTPVPVGLFFAAPVVH